MLKVGLVGVGSISAVHIPAWESMEDVELVALCDIRSEQMEGYPEKRHYLDFDEMLVKENLDILDICLPTYLHADYAIKAMEKGIHVISEKPISLNAADVDRVYSTAKRMDVNFMVAHVLRFWPEYMLLKEIYDTQKFGKLLSGYMGRLGTVPWASWNRWMQDESKSGLVPFDLHIHDLDFMVHAFGTPIKVKNHRSRHKYQDCLNIVYEYKDFYIVTEAAWYASPYPFTPSFRFQFEKAIVAWENRKCTIYHNDGTIEELSEIKEEAVAGSMMPPKTIAYYNEIRYFVDCVQNGVFPDRVKAEELHSVIEILKSL